MSLLSSNPLPEIKSDEHKLQYAKERQCLEAKVFYKFDLKIKAEKVCKGLEAKVKAMRSKSYLPKDILEVIKSCQWCYKTLYYEEISPKAKYVALKNHL